MEDILAGGRVHRVAPILLGLGDLGDLAAVLPVHGGQLQQTLGVSLLQRRLLLHELGDVVQKLQLGLVLPVQVVEVLLKKSKMIF